MDEDINLSQTLLRTMIHFLENGDTTSIVGEEIKNYFKICKQIEIYYEKFRQKGYFISFDVENSLFSLASNEQKNKYDIARMADCLYERMCRWSTPDGLFTVATRAFVEDFGTDRFSKCVKNMAVLKRGFNLMTAINSSIGSKYNMEAVLIMESYEAISFKPNGMDRVNCLVMELILEDECSETVVSMIGIDTEVGNSICLEVKKILVDKLNQKFQKLPHANLWFKILKSRDLVEAVDRFEPFLNFILDIIKEFSKSLYQSSTKEFLSAPGCLSYAGLTHIMHRLYRSKTSRQAIVNFIFDQCAINSELWNSVLNSCHKLPPHEEPVEFFSFDEPPKLKQIEYFSNK